MIVQSRIDIAVEKLFAQAQPGSQIKDDFQIGARLMQRLHYWRPQLRPGGGFLGCRE